MANIELKKVEQQLNHRVLYSVKVNTDADHMEFPIGIQDEGSATSSPAIARGPCGAAPIASSLIFRDAGLYAWTQPPALAA